MINRSVVILRWQKPFLDWVAGLPGARIEADPDAEPVAYLVRPFDGEKGGREVLERSWPILFEAELYAWWTDEAGWPRDRSLAMFFEWFRVESYAVVEDVCGGEIGEEGGEGDAPDIEEAPD